MGSENDVSSGDGVGGTRTVFSRRDSLALSCRLNLKTSCIGIVTGGGGGEEIQEVHGNNINAEIDNIIKLGIMDALEAQINDFIRTKFSELI